MLLYMDMLLIKLNIKKSLSLHHKSLASELLPPPACGVNVIPIAISAAVVDVTITPHIRHVAGQTNGLPTGKYIHFVLAAYQNLEKYKSSRGPYCTVFVQKAHAIEGQLCNQRTKRLHSSVSKVLSIA